MLRPDFDEFARIARVRLVPLLAAVCLLTSCHTRDADEGSFRARKDDVVGVYETSLDHDSERLELKDNGTYVQECPSIPLRHTGNWHLEDEFLDGSAVVLSNAAVCLSLEEHLDGKSSRPPDKEVGFGEIRLYTHKRDGKTALARNEVADWYYERVQ